MTDMNREELIEEMLLESGLGAVRGGRPTPGSVERMKVAVAVFEEAAADRLRDAEARLSEIRALHSSLADDAGGDWSFREYANEILDR